MSLIQSSPRHEINKSAGLQVHFAVPVPISSSPTPFSRCRGCVADSVEEKISENEPVRPKPQRDGDRPTRPRRLAVQVTQRRSPENDPRVETQTHLCCRKRKERDGSATGHRVLHTCTYMLLDSAYCVLGRRHRRFRRVHLQRCSSISGALTRLL